MGKVIVTANEDFFDRSNQIARTQGSTFVLKEEYAKELGKQVKIGKKFGVEQEETKKEAPPKKETEKKSNTKAGAKKQYTNAGIEKVKKH